MAAISKNILKWLFLGHLLLNVSSYIHFERVKLELTLFHRLLYSFIYENVLLCIFYIVFVFVLRMYVKSVRKSGLGYNPVPNMCSKLS